MFVAQSDTVGAVTVENKEFVAPSSQVGFSFAPTPNNILFI